MYNKQNLNGMSGDKLEAMLNKTLASAKLAVLQQDALTAELQRRLDANEPGIAASLERVAQLKTDQAARLGLSSEELADLEQAMREFTPAV